MADSQTGLDTSASPLSALKRISAELARDPLLIQGAGGNTSLKRDDVLWVKASGCWLEDAQDKPIFMSLRLSKVLSNIIAQTADSCAGAPLSDQSSGALKPSIETALHAIMPHFAVIHAHAVNSTTTALLADGRARFERAMGGDLHGLYLPYATPGLPLANAVRDAVIGNTPPDIILLQNHGVVVGADSPDAAARLLREVERRLAFAPRALPLPDQKRLSAHESPVYEAVPLGNGMALDPYLFDLLTTFVFTPDQVVFLGGPVRGIGRDDSTPEAAAAPALILREGVGAYRRRDASPGTQAVITWLAHIAERIPEGAEALSLPDGEVASLLGWDAEQYRLKLDQSRRPRN